MAIMFEVIVWGIVELSVTSSWKFQVPVGVDVVGEKVYSDALAPVMGVKIPPLKASSHW